MERLNAFTLLKSVDNGRLFQTLLNTLHAKKRLLAKLVLLGLYSLYMWPRVTVHGHNSRHTLNQRHQIQFYSTTSLCEGALIQCGASLLISIFGHKTVSSVQRLAASLFVNRF